jgi:hypothetical protein
MDSNNCLLFEMRVLNELRKLKPEQRKELVDTLEREEKLEEDALKKNPNLHVENKLQQVLTELKELRNEVQILKNNTKNAICTLSLDNINNINNIPCHSNDDLDGEECPFLSIDWWPIIIFLFIFLALLSIPSSVIKGCRPNPLVI